MGQLLKLATIAVILATMVGPALGQTFDSGSTGADGAFNPTCMPTPCTVTVTLPESGIFNYTTIDIPSGVTVKFTRNAANTPVTLLASGNVTITGAIDVRGSAGGPSMNATNLQLPNGGAGGPGGYDGGSGSNALVSEAGGAGLGPGGGGGGASGNNGGGGGGGFSANGQGGQSQSPGVGGTTYGSPILLPLVGGSGGGGGSAVFGASGGGGGGGGGAILIASSATVTVTGKVLADGGHGGGEVDWGGGPGGGGSGGAIRLAATSITGTGGSLSVLGGGGGAIQFATGGAGAQGRIRVEAFGNTSGVSYSVPPSLDQPGLVALANTPSLRITSVAGAAAPVSPTGSYSTPDITLPSGTTNPITVVVTASNIPPGTVVTVLSSGLAGGSTSGTGTLSGSASSSTASATVTIPTNEPTVISASATFTVSSLGGGPAYATREEVERVRVSATASGVSHVAYITRSGREIQVR